MEQTAGKHKGKRILLVEDDKFIARAYQDGLERAGFKVSVAYDGRVALEYLQHEQHPDLILLDIIIPVIDGFEVLQTIKADEKTKDIPVIIVSNLGQESDVTKGKEVGAADYLIKANWSMDDVVKKINTYLDKL
jgi:DNA-binding response OmpR family regulator